MAKNLDDDGNVPQDPGGNKRFLEARNGDHLMVPFQCELCHFRNVYEREPEPHNFKDKEFLCLLDKQTWTHSGAVGHQQLGTT